jgi:hypothetical protein
MRVYYQRCHQGVIIQEGAAESRVSLIVFTADKLQWRDTVSTRNRANAIEKFGYCLPRHQDVIIQEVVVGSRVSLILFTPYILQWDTVSTRNRANAFKKFGFQSSHFAVSCGLIQCLGM